MLRQVLDALAMAGSMGWQILWPLILGFTLSGVIQAVVRREKVTALMSDDSPRALAAATGLGAASSSCSYASVAIARSLFRKGALDIHPAPPPARHPVAELNLRRRLAPRRIRRATRPRLVLRRATSARTRTAP